MAHKPTLTYFNIRGLGEIPRLLLAEAGVDFVDNRVEKIDDLKASGKLLYGQVPLYEEDGFTLSQSGAIARYIARSHNLYGATPKDGAVIDQVLEGLNDVRAQVRGVDQVKDDEAKHNEAKNKFVNETFPKFLTAFEKQLQGEYFLGHQVSLADISLYYYLDYINGTYPGVFDKHPKLVEHSHRVTSRPNIAKWLAHRPQK